MTGSAQRVFLSHTSEFGEFHSGSSSSRRAVSASIAAPFPEVGSAAGVVLGGNDGLTEPVHRRRFHRDRRTPQQDGQAGPGGGQPARGPPPDGPGGNVFAQGRE